MILIFSFLLTLLIFAPLIAFPYVLGEDYKGININWFGTDSHFYLSRGQEVLEGHKLGNSLLREGKDGQDPYFTISEYILLTPVKLLGLADKVNVVTLYNTYNFIGVFILIILVYFFVWQLSGSKLLSITAALFAIGGYSLVYNKALFYRDFNVYARVIYPFFSSLILFIYLNFLVKSLKSEKLKFQIFAGLVFSLLFYIYFYAWSFALALGACMLLVLLLMKDFKNVKKILFISATGLLFGAYNLFQLFSSLGSAGGKQQAYFLLLAYGRAPIFSKIGFITLIIFAVYWFFQKRDKSMPLVLSIILAGWVALNQQIITGRMLQYGHYYFYFIVPMSIIVSLYMIWQIIKYEKLRKYLFMLLIAVVFINAMGGQYLSFIYTYDLKKYEQNFRPIINALNSDKTPGVILAGQENEYLFTIYTPHDLFWHGAATIYNAPIKRVKDAIFVYTYLGKNSRNNFKGFIEQMMAKNKSSAYAYDKGNYMSYEGYTLGYYYYDYLKKLAARDPELLAKREKLLTDLAAEYENLIKDNGQGIKNLLKDYGVNYIVWDKNKPLGWDLTFLGRLDELANFNNIYLYQVNL